MAPESSNAWAMTAQSPRLAPVTSAAEPSTFIAVPSDVAAARMVTVFRSWLAKRGSYPLDATGLDWEVAPAQGTTAIFGY